MDTYEHGRIADYKNPYPLIDEGFYNLQMVKADVTKSPDGADSSWERFNFRFRIVNDESFAGRVFFSTQFASRVFMNGLYKVSEATGVEQGDEETVEEYVQTLVNSGDAGVFKARVVQKLDKFHSTPETVNADGTVSPAVEAFENDVKLSTAQIADPFVS